MKKMITLFALTLLVLFLSSQSVFAQQLSEAEIKKKIIQQSIAEYPGVCPCPYSLNRRGNPCANFSAYVKLGGYTPICYETDITPEMIEEHLKKNGKN